MFLLPVLPLLLFALLPLQTVSQTRVVPGVSLEESQQIEFPLERWRGTPMTPAWKTLLERAQAEGWRGSTNGPISGVRRHSDQKYLYRLWREGRGAPAFPPSGPSRHLLRNVKTWGQWSQAVDVSRPRELQAVARRLGVELYAPYDPEPWHIEARFAFSLPDKVTVSKEKQPLIPLFAPLLLLGALLLWRFRHVIRRPGL